MGDTVTVVVLVKSWWEDQTLAGDIEVAGEELQTVVVVTIVAITLCSAPGAMYWTGFGRSVLGGPPL